MQIANLFDSIKIDEMDAKDAAVSMASYAKLAEPGLRWFRIISKSWDGYVYASTVHSHEDDGERNGPSAIYEPGLILVSLAVHSSWFGERYEAPVRKAIKFPSRKIEPG
ncbi:MAG TPA: hypothetical protein VFC44_11635 [Candidatus Saccharimonadales bacterium]|nr:hypothetical protein [Candidatus Saccharimonadales bacterium]